MNGLIPEIQRQYHVTVYGHEESDLGLALETNRGNAFLYSLPKSYLPKSSMIKDVYHKMNKSRLLLPIIPTKSGEEILQIEDESYYMTAWPQAGTEIVDYAYLGYSLAEFHLATGKQVGPMKSKFNAWGSWSKDWTNRVSKLEKYRKNASKRTEREEASEFDQFLLNNYDYLQYLGYKAVAYLGDSDYAKVAQQTVDRGVVSYTNFGFDQFVISPQKRGVYFADAFSWLEDMRARDLAQFIKADVREFGWNPYHIHAFLMAYHSRSPILPEEFPIMYATFMLPGRVLKKLESLNYKPKLWVDLIEETERSDADTEGYTSAVAYKELQRNEVLLREFPRYVKQAFGVGIPGI